MLTNACHLPSSCSMLAAYSSGVLGIGPPPSETGCSCNVLRIGNQTKLALVSVWYSPLSAERR